ncbi:hypothetical protein [Rhizobacter sp. P5_C2]
MKLNPLLAAALAIPLLALTGCGGNDAEAVASLPSAIDVGNGIPEDIEVDGSRAYVSNLSDGSILQLDLARGGAASTFVPAASDAYSAAWGLKVVRSKGWLLSVQNQPYDFNPAHAQAGRVTAFDLSTGAVVKRWNLPAQAVGNSIDVDAQGRIYVGDIGPHPRILRIDPATDQLTTWATDARWPEGGFGIGGMVQGGGGIYAAHDNRLWFIGLAEDGSARAALPVQVEGDPVIFADGMRWTNGGIDYAENDLFTAGAKGSVYRIEFTNPTTARRTVLAADLFDPSGIATVTLDGRNWLLVNESRLGYAVGTETGAPKLPYQVKALRR